MISRTLALPVLVSAVLLTSCGVHAGMKEMKAARYAAGEHIGPKQCATCHEKIYGQWLANSRHAEATSAPSFHRFKKEVEDSFLLATMMGTRFCHNCHGPEKVNSGVDCETCHGPGGGYASMNDLHEKIYKPSMELLKDSNFCLKCHALKNPMSGEEMMMSPADIAASPAYKNGISCQECHMKKNDGIAYHGFDTAIKNRHSYDNDLAIGNIRLEKSSLRLTLKNNVTGHPIPAGGAVRILALEILLFDGEGRQIHAATAAFYKKFEMMPIAGIMPWNLLENTQLRGGEAREIAFAIPQGIEEAVTRGRFTLRFYEVMDEYQGDISKAMWKGEPFLTLEKDL